MVKILLAEDNKGDVILTKKAFTAAKIRNELIIAENGEVAMDMLLKRNGYEDLDTPDLILLDINMPKKDGKQVLAEMDKYKELKRIPVIILTSSEAEKDVLETYDLNASSYIVKPVDMCKFHQVVSAIEDFWFDVVILPNDF